MPLDRKPPEYRAVETLLSGEDKGLQFTFNNVVGGALRKAGGKLTDIALNPEIDSIRCPDREKALVRLALFLWDGSCPVDTQDLELLTRADRERFLAALATYLGLPWVAPKPPAPEWKKEGPELLARQRDSFKDLPEQLKDVMEGSTATGAAIIQQGFDPATRKLLTGDRMAALSQAGIHPKRPRNRAAANAMTAYGFGDGGFEGLRAKGRALGAREVRSLMAGAAPRVAAWLRVREMAMSPGPGGWWAWANAYGKLRCQGWAKR